jgi:hypothetical protein
VERLAAALREADLLELLGEAPQASGARLTRGRDHR